LYERYQNLTFLSASAAAAQLGLSISGIPPDTIEIFTKEWERAEGSGAARESANRALKNFCGGIANAYAQREIEIGPRMPKPEKLTFASLERFLKINI
jgi:hypothetical protein